MNTNDLNILGFAFTNLSLAFAFYIFFKTRYEQRRQFITVLRNQLSCTGPWVSSESPGYTKSDDTLKFNNSNPFKLIFTMANEPLISLSLLPAFSAIDSRVAGHISEFNQDAIRIKNIQEFKEKFVFSQINLSNDVLKRWKKHESKYNSNNYFKFYDSLSEQEKIFVDRLVRYGDQIHVEIIGHPGHGMRQHWEEINQWTTLEEKRLKSIQTYVIDVLILSIITAASIYAIFSLSSLSFLSNSNLPLNVILISFLSMVSALMYGYLIIYSK